MSSSGGKNRSPTPQVVSTVFIWPHGGRHVHICGSFTSWQNTLPMSPVDSCSSVFQIACNLPIGYYEYKFVVDGEWRYDHQSPVACDPHGNVRNCVYVKLPEVNGDATTTGSSMDVDLSSGHHMIDLHEEANSSAHESRSISAADVETSKHRIVEFLLQHTAYELIPESSKVVLFDASLPVKQAFHILHEQGLTVAPIWDSGKQEFVGVLSASDFIIILRQLHDLGATLSQEELDTHTIAVWKAEKASILGLQRRRPLVSAGPDDSLRVVTDKLLLQDVATIPLLNYAAEDGFIPQLLHLASLSEILKCMLRHFRHVPSWLPLLVQPIYALPLGTWSPEVGGARCRPLALLRANAPLSSAFTLLLQAGVSALPVIDDKDSLIDVYTRSDVTALAKEKAYARVELNEVTVGEALQMGQNSKTGIEGAGTGTGVRCHMCLRSNTLKDVIERLASPGVRRVICVEAGSRHVEGIISLRDVFSFFLG